MTPRFVPAVGFVLNHETEFQKGHDGDFNFAITEHDPSDPGGATKYGIDQRSHPEVDIDSLTVDRAREIYFRSYWGPSHAEALPLGIGEACFDAAVNCGIGRSAIWLQTALRNAGTYHGSLDGSIGPLTVAAAAASDSALIVEAMLNARRDFYRRLAAARPKMGKYLRGWLARVDDLSAFVTALSKPALLSMKDRVFTPRRWQSPDMLKPLRAAA